MFKQKDGQLLLNEHREKLPPIVPKTPRNRATTLLVDFYDQIN